MATFGDAGRAPSLHETSRQGSAGLPCRESLPRVLDVRCSHRPSVGCTASPGTVEYHRCTTGASVEPSTGSSGTESTRLDIPTVIRYTSPPVEPDSLRMWC